MLGFFHHLDIAGTCGCHGDDFMAEGSDALLDRLDRVMKNEFDAKMLERTLSRHEQEIDVLQLERGDTVRHTARRVAWTCRHSSGDEDTNSGNKGNRWRRPRYLGTAGYLSGSNLPLGGGVDRKHCPGQT